MNGIQQSGDYLAIVFASYFVVGLCNSNVMTLTVAVKYWRIVLCGKASTAMRKGLV